MRALEIGAGEGLEAIEVVERADPLAVISSPGPPMPIGCG